MNSSGKNIIYVDTLEAYKLVLKNIDFRQDSIITDNPLLANDTLTKNNIEDISIYLKQEKGSEIGQLVLDLSEEIENSIKAKKYKEKYNYYTDKIGLYLVVRGLFQSVIQRAIMMALFLKNQDVTSIKLVIPKTVDFDPTMPWNIYRFANPFKFLAELGFFAKLPFSIEYINVDIPKEFNDTREKNFLLRTVIWPKAFIFYNLFKFLNYFLSGKKKIYYARKCESLRETIPWLQIKGYKLEKIKFPTASILKENIFLRKEDIERDLGSIILKYLNFIDFRVEQAEAQKKLFIKHITLGLNQLSEDVRQLNDFFKSKKFETKFIITAGFYGPIANQLFYLCKKYNLFLIGFEHGLTTGINFSSSKYTHQLESTTCNLLMVCSNAAKQEFEASNIRHKDSIDNKVFVMGESDQKKNVFFPSIQRLIARRRFKIKNNKEEVVIHVSGLVYGGNIRNLSDDPVESYLFNKDKILLEKVYNNINKTVIYKSYPTQRMLHQPPCSSNSQLSSNIIFTDYSDFRYIRSAADIIVTDSNSSTLSWCIINEVPLIFLRSSICLKLQNDKIENLFKEAFFLVDMDHLDWDKKLKVILNLSKKELIEKWHRKKEAREELNENYLLGPKGTSGLRAANHIDELFKHNLKLH